MYLFPSKHLLICTLYKYVICHSKQLNSYQRSNDCCNNGTLLRITNYNVEQRNHNCLHGAAPFSEAYNHSASQEIPCLICNPIVRYCLYRVS
jgi:hypothetical protein